MDQVLPAHPGSGFNDRMYLMIASICASLKAQTERRHRAFLTGLDAVAQIVVAAGRIRELRPLAGNPSAIRVTPAAAGCEQLFDIECCVVRRGGGRLRRSRHGACQRGGQHRDQQQRHDAQVQPHRARIRRMSRFECTGSAACARSPVIPSRQSISGYRR